MSPTIKCGELVLKLETEEPNELLLEKAYKELRETPQNIEQGLKELKRLLEAEKDLIIPINNDEWLLTFLRTCKFYPESARDLMKRFYNIRLKYPEVRRLLLPSKLKSVFDAGLVSILPVRDQHGRRIVITLSGKKWDYKINSGDALYSSGVLCSEILYKEPATQINGIVYLLDLEGFSLGHVIQYTPYNLKRCLDFLQGNSALRIEGFHIVNQPKIFQPILNAVKPFFTPKFAKRIIMHGTNYESLHKYIAPECLPKWYGGKLDMESIYSNETYQLLSHYEKEFEDFRKWGYKTSKD